MGGLHAADEAHRLVGDIGDQQVVTQFSEKALGGIRLRGPSKR